MFSSSPAALPIRRPALDIARFVAAFGVVVAHVQASISDWIGHLSLGIFLLLTAVLAVQSFARTGAYSVRARFWRLMLPWLFWCGFYWLVNYDVSDRAAFFVWPSEPWSLLAGPSIHLWFLPFILAAGFLVEPVGRFVTNEKRLLIALAVSLVVMILCFSVHIGAGLAQPLEQWTFGLPVYVLGLLFGLALPMGRPLWVLAALVLGTVISLAAASHEPWIWQALLAFVIFWALWHLPISGPIPEILGREAFGIYLMHPFFLLVIYKFLGPNLGWVADCALAFTMSWAAAMIMHRLPWVNRLI